MTVQEMRLEILRNLALPINGTSSGDTDLTDAVILQYLMDAHNQLAEESLCYSRQVIIPTVKSAKKIIVCTISSAPSDDTTFIVGTPSGNKTYTFKTSDLSGTNAVLSDANYCKNLADAINGYGMGSTCNTDIAALQYFTASYTSTTVTLTGISYDATLNSYGVSGTCGVTSSTTNGVDGLIYSLPVDVIHIDKITHGGVELKVCDVDKENIYDSVPTGYERYSTNQIIINGYSAQQYPLILHTFVIPDDTINIIPTLAAGSLSTNTPYGIPAMYHRILVYIVVARVMTEMFADTIDGAQQRIQSAIAMVNMMTTQFKAGLIAW